jgi:hypothetical protein
MWPLKQLGRVLMIGGYFAASQAMGAETPDLPPTGETSPQLQPQLQPVPTPGNGPSRQNARSQESQSFLDAQSENDRRKLLDKQQRTFQLEVDGKYAKALKAYCDTGYGDDRCFRPEAGKQLAIVAPAPATALGPSESPSSTAQKTHPLTAIKELPTVVQISGFGEELSAILVFGNGRRLRVFAPGSNGPRSMLPDGEAVVSIRPGEVLIARNGGGKPIPLLFQSTAPNLPGSE